MEGESELLYRAAEKIYKENGDLGRAKKLLEKSIQLNGGNDKVAKELLQKVEEKTEEKKVETYTKEQLDSIERVRKCKDYYERLELDRNATENEIRKAYKKFAVLFHPDKNRAPGADEAFKAISKAYSVLINPEKRRAYDHDSLDQNGNIRQQFSFADDDISPEELFHNIFGTSNIFNLGNSRYFVRPHFRHQQNQNMNQRAAVSNLWTQLAPIIIFLAVTIILNLFQAVPLYQFQQQSAYPLKRVTNNKKVIYYVKSDFPKTYDNEKSINKVEGEVENEYKTYLANMCYREEQERLYLMENGRIYGRKDLIDRANNMHMKYCEELRRYSKIN